MSLHKLQLLINSEPLNSDKLNADVLEWCNKESISVTKEARITERSMMADLGANEADAILTKLDAASQSNSALKRALKMLSPSEGGVDIGGGVARGMVDQLKVNGVLTEEEANSLKSLGEAVVSPCENAGLRPAKLGQIESIRGL